MSLRVDHDPQVCLADDTDLHLRKAIQEQLDKQRERDLSYQEKLKTERDALEAVLRDVGKASLSDRKRGLGEDGVSSHSVMVFPVVSDGGETEPKEGVHADEGVMGLVSRDHPEFFKCKAYARPMADAMAHSQSQLLRRDVHTLFDKVEKLENENYLRKLEVNILRRILESSGTYDTLSDAHKNVLDVMAKGTPDPAQKYPSLSLDTDDDLRAQREEERKTIARLTGDDLAGFLSAVYTEPSILRGMDHQSVV
eukprot:TRINITY_DN16974_c0_g1_i1.p2 TRINITY_DN16974_c0_g1~~TRINITY_DN16974_c0_g1_i1.p2  ORF type:complete len:253 (+),score=72.74 TRINITY_DN16974_c0_g1_i1:60-818(+)